MMYFQDFFECLNGASSAGSIYFHISACFKYDLGKFTSPTATWPCLFWITVNWHLAIIFDDNGTYEFFITEKDMSLFVLYIKLYFS